MTNGEKIIAILKPRKDQIRIYSNWVEIEIQKLGINFSCELDWWNTKCNEPTRIDLRVDAILRQAVIDELKRYFHDEYYQRTSIQDCRDCFIEDVLNHLPSVTPQEPTLDKIREEIGKAWHTKPKNRYEEGLKDQALKDMQIIDKYKAESEKT